MRHVSAFVRDHQLVDLSLPTVRVELWRADAIVLFEWLKTVEMNSVPTTHRVEKQALTDLLTRVEHETDIPSVTQTQIDDAREGRATQSQAKPSWTTLSSVPRRRCWASSGVTPRLPGQGPSCDAHA